MPSIEQIHALLTDEPNDPFLLYSLGHALTHAGDAEAALAAYGRAIDADRNYCAAYYHQARLLIDERRSAEAREVIAAGLEATQRTADGHTAEELRSLLLQCD